LYWKVFLFAAFFTAQAYSLFADAYLAEDKIYYGADTYSINYEDEIIEARGHAYFKKGEVTVYARRIVIYYSETKKEAELYDDVLIKNAEKIFEIRGNYGEAHYREEYYFVIGNALYKDEQRSIQAEKIETFRGENNLFSGNVAYSDESVTINAHSLEIDERDIAHFEGNISTLFLDSGDTLFCEHIRHFMNSGNSEFQGDVVYIQAQNSDDEEKALVIQSEVIRYGYESDSMLFLDNVYMVNGEYALRAPIVKYNRKSRFLESGGDTVVYNGRNTIYCNRFTLDVDSGKIVFIGSVKGLFSMPEGRNGFEN